MRSFSTLHLLPMLLACGGLSALNAQTVTADKTSLAFFSQVGGSALSQTLNVTSTSGATNFAVFVGSGTWLKVNGQIATNGTTPSAVTVTADPTGLAAGVYNGTLTVSGGVSAVPSVAVTLTVSQIGINPQSVTFSYTMGGTVPGPQNVTLTGPFTTYTAAATTQSGGNWFGLAVNNTLVNTLNGQSPGPLALGLNSTILPGLAAGTYNGAVTITPTSGSTTTPVTVAVVLTVTPTPPVSANPSSLTFNVQIAGTNNILTQPLTIATTQGVALNFAIGSSVNPNPAGKNWIVLGTSSGATAAGTGTASVNIGVDSSNLPVGTYTGNVTVVSQGTPSSLVVPITLLISNSPLLNVPSTALNFTFQIGGSTPASQSVTVTATSGTLQFTIADPNNRPWLTMPSTGTTPTPFTVAINPAGLAGLTPGTYSTTLNITGIGAGNGVQQIPVNLTVTNNPNIVSSVSALSFPFQIGKATPAPVTVNLTSTTGATLNYTATAATTTCGSAWLLLNGSVNGTASGTTAGSFAVGINTAGLVAGNCTGTISVAATNLDGTAVGNSPLSIAVTLVVSNSPLLLANPSTSLSFTTQVGQSPATQQVSLATTSATDQVSFSAAFTTSSGGNWLPVGQTITGTTPSNILIPVASSLLSAGSYAGTVTITASGPGGAAVANSPLVIPVTLTVTSGSLTVSATTLSFSQTLGGTTPAAQTVTLGSIGQPLNYTAAANSVGNWLSVTPTGGATGANPTLSVSVDGSHLTAGLYVGTITVVSPGAANSPATITVNFTVTPGTISAPTTTLTFNQVAGGAAPAAQTFNVTSTPASVAFTVAASTVSGGNWLTATPASGNTPGTVSVSVSAGTLTPGIYRGSVTVTSAATGSPISVPVTFNVLAAQTLVASPTSINFAQTLGLPAPAAQSLQVSAATAGTPFTVTAAVTSGPAGWLVVTPASGNTPAAVTVSIVTTGLVAGTFNGTITIASPNAVTPATVPVTLTVAAVPTPLVTAIINAASGNTTGGLAPGEIVAIFGTGIGPATPAGLQVSNGTVTSIIGNTRVLFDGVAAPVIFASATQTNVIVPFGVAGRTSTNVQVEFLGVQSAANSYTVASTSPAIFSLNLSGTGPGATLNQDGVTANGPATPAAKGSVVSVFMTGEGQTTPTGVNGAVTPSDGSGLKKPNLPVTATIGGVAATVLYAGSAPGLVSGVMQVNIQIPADAPSGTAVPLAITVGATATQAGITIAVQ